MVTYDWSDEKNAWLKKERGVSFEEVIMHIEAGNAVDVLPHPNPAKYPKQQILVVLINDYAYIVPYVSDGDLIFLKTVIPSRAATKKYLKGNLEND